MLLQAQRFVVFLFLLLAPCANAGQQFSVSVDACSGSGDTFSLDSVSIVCDGFCYWGSTASFQGTFTIGESGVYTQYPTLSAKAWGMEIYNSNNSSSLDLCGNVQSTSGGSCPSEGTYTFVANATLPQSKSFSVFSSSMHMTVATLFDFTDEEVICSFSVTSTNWMFSSSTSSAAMFLFLGAAFCAKKRRRVVTSEDQANDGVVDEEEPSTHFEMMERIEKNGHLFSR